MATNWAAIANGATISNSSVYTSGVAAGTYDKDYAFNGNRTFPSNWSGANGGIWHSANNANSDSITSIFAATSPIDEINIFTVPDSFSNTATPTLSTTFTSYGITGAILQYLRHSDLTWITIATISGDFKQWKQFTGLGITGADGVRLINIASPDGFARACEIEAWGDPPADTTPPSDVTGFTATKINDSQINLTSNDATDNIGVSGYVTERRINGGSWSALASTAKTFSDTSGLPSYVGTHTVEYRRKAKDTANNVSANWAYSSSISIVIDAPPVNPAKPADVGDVKAHPYSHNQIKVVWDGIGTGITYLVQIAPHSDFTDVSQFESNKLFIIFDAIPVGEFFYIRVKARNLDGIESENWSDTAIVKITSGTNLNDYFEEFRLSQIFNITQLDLEMPVLTADFGDGYGAGALSGKASGLRYWSISADLLPDMEEYSVSYLSGGDAESDTRFNYIWEFYRRHLALGNKPFYFRDPRTDRVFLASFVERRISFESLTAKLYRGGVQIKQRRVKISGIIYSEADGAIEH